MFKTKYVLWSICTVANLFTSAFTILITLNVAYRYNYDIKAAIRLFLY